MPSSDALIVGEDWISEHYFTTDATKESFFARAVERRKEWESEGKEKRPTTRSRFLTARADIEARILALADGELNDEAAPGSSAATAAGSEVDDGKLNTLLLDVLGYRPGEYVLTREGPLTWVSLPGLDARPAVVIAARPATDVEDLLEKHATTLLTPWERDDQDPIVSVALALSTLMVDADGPAYAIVLAGPWCLVAEKERWPEGRWLGVNLQLVVERNETTRGGETDRALICLEAASLLPDATGTTWWTETLEASVKHTVGVSKDLREGVRRSIEIIANEVVARRRARGLEPLPAQEAQTLAVESLRYLYRILFLLYAEASPELGVLPVGAGEYDAGYGLDRLRELALRDLVEPRSRAGTHLDESLNTLFVLVDRGHRPRGGEGLPDGLEFQALRADLFRPEATALIDEAQLGNAALLQVLQKLLLNSAKDKEQRGFISYVDLGINQLGAVYEGLMSYTGSFAAEDLYEVAKNGDPQDGSWVVPVSRSAHLDEKDFVTEPDEETGERHKVLHRAGAFVFRLSGRDRQRSASYYTPEVLTKFTVSEALEELLDQDGTRTSAEEIQQLTVCEPALGSGAFAIEAVRQLAEAYLSRREQELGERVDPDERPRELQKVKAHIALHQVYGVDLNATAVELAEVSLWLDTMVAGLAAPWFGLRLRRGNSLIGTKHAHHATAALKGKGNAWLTEPPTPEPLTAVAARLAGQDAPASAARVAHFLLPARGWGAAAEAPKAVRDLVSPETIKRLKAWRTQLRKRPDKTAIARLEALSRRVERLWEITLRRLRIAEAESSRRIDLWGRDTTGPTSTVTREQIEASLADEDGAYRRLRLVMDAWCALWYWPLTPVEATPPTLAEWLDACEGILGNGALTAASRKGMKMLPPGLTWDDLGEAERLDLEFAFARPVEKVRRKHAWLAACERIATEQGFFHWELDFATVFARGGFDLQVGNPPWVRPTVDVESLLAEGDPWWALALKPSQARKAERKPVALHLPGVWKSVLDGSIDNAVLAGYLADTVVYPVLSGQPDLYRAFMNQVWDNASPHGMSALIHMESHFTDDKALELRAATYRHLRRHWQFINELVLFDIDHHVTYGLNIYGAAQPVDFLHATALYHPSTVPASRRHDGSGSEPGFKNAEGRWDTSAHSGRIQQVTEATLRLWQEIRDAPGWPSTPMVYTVNSAAARTLDILAKRERIGSLGLQFSAGWHERADREKGRFVSGWGRVEWSEAILQGPHLHVSTPLYKAPNSTMKHNLDWSPTDFDELAADGLPVTAYKPSGDRLVYDASYTRWTLPDGAVTPARDHYRVAWRTMAANTGERTLIAGVMPKHSAHVDGVFSVGAPSQVPSPLMAVAATASTLLTDFYVRTAPKSTIRARTFERLPMVPLDHPLINSLILRTLRLNCLTDAYADLWTESWRDEFADDGPILPRFDERRMGPRWTMDTPLRRAVDRRNAQVEIDALVALMLGVPVEDLCTIYRTQFAVLYGYDHREYTYDRQGRLVPYEVLNRWRKRDEPSNNADMSVAERTATHPGSGVAYTYDLPFTLLDREDDFRTAYAEFERRLAAKTGSHAATEETP